MEETHAAFESSPNEVNGVSVSHSNSDHGWHKVTYAKRQKKTKPTKNSDSLANPNKIVANGTLAGADNVFRSLEQQSEDRRRRILEAQRAANAGSADVPVRSKERSDYDDDEDEEDDNTDHVAENGKAEEVKKLKQKKPKKPKVTVAEAAAKIDAADLVAFLAEISVGHLDWLLGFESRTIICVFGFDLLV